MEEEQRLLTKKERRALAKEKKREEREREQVTSKLKKFVIWILIFGFIFGGGYWLYKGATKPLPGQAVEDLGREHVNDISEVKYNSDPPTSGSHFGVWAKKGVYGRVISDGYLIHSLEHGYVVISYNCTKKISNGSTSPSATSSGPSGSPSRARSSDLKSQISNLFYVYAHETGEPHEEPQPEADRPLDDVATEEAKPLTRMTLKPSGAMSWFTPENPPEDEVGLPNEFNSDECKDLVSKFSKLADKWQRLIIVPRPGLDTKIALTAWGRIDKFDDYDEERIKEFIDAFHNQGPEKTAE